MTSDDSDPRPWHTTRIFPAILLLPLVFLPTSVCNAQIVVGHLLEAGTALPVEGAFVVLVRESGEEEDGYLTNPAGLFRLRAGSAGQFRLRAERIGYETVFSPPFELRPGQGARIARGAGTFAQVMAKEGNLILLRLPSADVAHVLICGNTGSGKTVLARTMALSLAMYNRPRTLQLVFIDPKHRGFNPLSALPHLLTPLIHQHERAAEVLARLAEEMERRDLGGRDTPRIVVFIDELADLIMSAGDAVEKPLTRLAQRGREAGIHLVACTQRPAASGGRQPFPGAVPAPGGDLAEAGRRTPDPRCQ